MYLTGSIGDVVVACVKLRERIPVVVLPGDSLAVQILCDAADRAVTWNYHDQIIAEIERIRKLELK